MWDIFLENCQRIRDIFKVGLISRQTNSRSWIHKVTKRIFENSYLRISIVLSIVLYFREMVRIVMDIYMYMTYQITNALKVNWNWELKQYLLFFFFFFCESLSPLSNASILDNEYMSVKKRLEFRCDGFTMLKERTYEFLR